MNDQEFEIINRETKKQKTIDFVKKNKNIFLVAPNTTYIFDCVKKDKINFP